MDKQPERLLHVAKLLIEYAGGSMQRTNLNKALFYFDLLWFAERGETYTGSTYVALPRGPVVDDYKTVLIAPLLASGDVTEAEIDLGVGMVAMPLRVHASPPPPGDEHTEVLLRRIADMASSRTAVALSELSHANAGWRVAMRRGTGTEISMLTALSQIGRRDPWLDEPLTDEEQFAIDGQLDLVEFD